MTAQTHPHWTVAPSQEFDSKTTLPRVPELPPGIANPVVLCLPTGAVLDPGALARVATEIVNIGARLTTWDLELEGADHGRSESTEQVLRFGWSPETLLSADYTMGTFALNWSDYVAAARSVPETEPLTPWSLLLRLPSDLAPTSHLAIPLVRLPRSAAMDDEMARTIIQGGLRFRGIQADCERDNGVTRLRWHRGNWRSVTLIVPTRHNEGMLGPLLESLRLTTGPRFDVVVVDNGERTSANEAWYERDWGFPLRAMWWTETPFHYGRVNNAAVASSESDVVVLLNDDTRVLEPEWLAEMVGLLMQDGVGCVGSSLLAADGRLQHAGVWLGLGGYAGHLFAGLRPNEITIFGSTSWYRNTLAVTAACLAIRRSDYLRVGGLDERMVLCGSDVTLGLDLVSAGLRNICTPLVGLSHLESATRSAAPVVDQRVSLIRYQPWHDAGDPYGNVRLSLRSNRPVLRKVGESDPVAAERTRLGIRL